jgi:hypothetical protein
MDEDLLLISNIKKADIPWLKPANFGNPETKARLVEIYNRLSDSILPDVAGSIKSLEILKNNFIASGILQADKPIQSVEMMGYSVRDII